MTPERERKAKFVPPYLISGQSLAVDTTRLPRVKSIDDLEGLTIGVQQGNTSQPIAARLVADGKAKAVRVYDYGSIRTALTDLTSGECDAFMKLAPVLTELVKPIPGVEVVQRGISVENIAIAVGLEDQALMAPHHRCSGRAGAGRNVATIASEMAGQSVYGPEPGCALTRPRVAGVTALRWPLSIKATKGETSDHPGRR